MTVTKYLGSKKAARTKFMTWYNNNRLGFMSLKQFLSLDIEIQIGVFMSFFESHNICIVSYIGSHDVFIIDPALLSEEAKLDCNFFVDYAESEVKYIKYYDNSLELNDYSIVEQYALAFKVGFDFLNTYTMKVNPF